MEIRSLLINRLQFFAFCLGFWVLFGILEVRPSFAQSLDGKRIRSITVQLRQIFDEGDLNYIYRAANRAKIKTREYVIRRELLFKEGDVVDEFMLKESERRLRALRYLRKVNIKPTVVGDEVDLVVSVQDTWTFIPNFSFATQGGKDNRSVGLTESNVMGFGKRAEILYEEDENRKIIEGVYDDPRVFSTDYKFTTAIFQRSDGNRVYNYFGEPFRTLYDRRSWYLSSDNSDLVGRLFKNGDERYIFRQKLDAVRGRYTFTRGNPESNLWRYSVGYDYLYDRFSQADAEDYKDLDLDPAVVSNDPALLPDARRFSGPVFTSKYIEPDYISMNYVDRFDRVEDYNLGAEYDYSMMLAPEEFGSNVDAMLVSGNRSAGFRITRGAFLRGEIGAASRWESGGLANSLLRAEMKYYQVLGTLQWGDLFLGKHTLAASFFVDYGEDLDRDREFVLGADNGLRGYKARAFVGDKRGLLNIEDRMHFIDDAFKLVSIGGAVFCDVGGATRNRLSDVFGEDAYADVGIGLRLAFPRSSGGRVMRIDLAFPLRDADDGSGQFEIRASLTGGQAFDSRLRSENLGPEQSNVSVGLDR